MDWEFRLITLYEFILGLTPANKHDLTAFRHIASQFHDGPLYLDKAYADELLTQLSQAELTILTPVKKAKGQTYLDAADLLWSTAVSRVRQPIESLSSLQSS